MVTVIIAILLLLAGWVLFSKQPTNDNQIDLARRVGELSEKLEEKKRENQDLEHKFLQASAAFQQELENNTKIISQKKSSETRLGQITEHIAPFLEEFPFDPKNCHFLGMPIDFVVFDFDDGAIHFVEIKTGNAKESHRQKLVKNIIKNGRVYYSKVQVNEKGIKVTETENNE